MKRLPPSQRPPTPEEERTLRMMGICEEELGRPPTLAELAGYLQVHKYVVVDRLGRLLRRGYVERPRAYAHRATRLSAAGRALVAATLALVLWAAPARAAELGELVDLWGEPDRAGPAPMPYRPGWRILEWDLDDMWWPLFVLVDEEGEVQGVRMMPRGRLVPRDITAEVVRALAVRQARRRI